MNIHWYPGHMAKAKRKIAEDIKLVDIICEVLDARIPRSSSNPYVDEITKNKPRAVILNRADQADPSVTAEWTKYFAGQGWAVIECDAKSGAGVNKFGPAISAALDERIKSLRAKGMTGARLRAMIVGIPNVGKSSFINRLANRKAAETADRPGVTRGRQWVVASKDIEVLDTPGILWQKLEDQDAALNLAFTGAIKDNILDTESIAAELFLRLARLCPDKVAERYKIEVGEETPGHELLERAARKRGFLQSGGVIDTERMAIIALDEFRGGKLGRVSLERP